MFSELGSLCGRRSLNPRWAESWRGADLLCVFAVHTWFAKRVVVFLAVWFTFPARGQGRHTPLGFCALLGNLGTQAGRLGFFQNPRKSFPSWKDQECNITSIALELFLLGHFRCFKFQDFPARAGRVKQPTARLLFSYPDSVSPQPPAELHLRKREISHPQGGQYDVNISSRETKIPKTSLTFPMLLSGKVRTRYPGHLKILVLPSPPWR